MAKITIKLAEESEKDLISGFMTSCLIEEYGQPPDAKTLIELLDFYFARSDSSIFCLMADNNTLAGFVWLIQSSDVITGTNFCCILYLAVRPEFRGNDYSRLLLNKARSFCKENNIGELRLSVRSDNDIALNLYNSTGFTTYKHEMLLKIE